MADNNNSVNYPTKKIYAKATCGRAPLPSTADEAELQEWAKFVHGQGMHCAEDADIILVAVEQIRKKRADITRRRQVALAGANRIAERVKDYCDRLGEVENHLCRDLLAFFGRNGYADRYRSYIDQDLSAQVKQTIGHEITEPSLVPTEYLSPDPVKIKAAIKAGVTQISGVRLITSDSLRIARRRGKKY